MFCGHCGEHMPNNNKFCTKCGAPVENVFLGDDTEDFYLITTTGSTVDYTNHQELISLVRNLKTDRVLIDLSGVDFIDSVGIGSFVTMTYTAARKGQDIKIALEAKSALKAIRTLGVDNILDIYATVEEAKGSWGIAAK